MTSKKCKVCFSKLNDINARKCHVCGAYQNWKSLLGLSTSLLAVITALISVSTLLFEKINPFLGTQKFSTELVYVNDNKVIVSSLNNTNEYVFLKNATFIHKNSDAPPSEFPLFIDTTERGVEPRTIGFFSLSTRLISEEMFSAEEVAGSDTNDMYFIDSIKEDFYGETEVYEGETCQILLTYNNFGTNETHSIDLKGEALLSYEEVSILLERMQKSLGEKFGEIEIHASDLQKIIESVCDEVYFRAFVSEFERLKS